MAAEQWQRGAPSKVAAWYSFGRGVGQSNVGSAKWYTKAAGQSNIGAMLGQGVDQNDVWVVKLFTKAEQGDAKSQFTLGT
ncbi:hypothetical protein BGZ91_009359, partial [Linnemannia elongata]